MLISFTSPCTPDSSSTKSPTFRLRSNSTMMPEMKLLKIALQAEAEADADRAQQQRQLGEVNVDGHETDHEAADQHDVVQDAAQRVYRGRVDPLAPRGDTRESVSQRARYPPSDDDDEGDAQQAQRGEWCAADLAQLIVRDVYDNRPDAAERRPRAGADVGVSRDGASQSQSDGCRDQRRGHERTAVAPSPHSQRLTRKATSRLVASAAISASTK